MNFTLKSALFMFLIAAVCKLAAQTPTEGFQALQLENWDEAIRIYSAITQKDATDQYSLLRLGDAYLGKQDKAKALETFRKTYAVKSDGPFAFISNARILLLENNSAEADKQLAKAAKAGRKDIHVLRAVGESYLYGATRNLTRAEQLLKQAYTFKTNDIQTLMQLGYCYKEMPNGGLAAQHYEFAQQADPTDAFPVFMQARVYRQAKLPEKYIDYLGKTLAKDPKHTLALRETAEYWYFTKRKYIEATNAYENFVNSGKASIDDEMQLANCYFFTQKYDKCIALVERIMGKDGSKNYLRRLLAYCYYETQEYQKSKHIIEEYFKAVQPDKIQAADYEYLAKTIVKTGGDTLQAIEKYREAIKMDATRWNLNKEIGALQYRKKMYCEAAVSYQLAIDSTQKPDATDYYYLGNCHYFCKDDPTPSKYERALAAYRKVAELAPNAGLGYYWSGKSAAKLDPDMQANPSKCTEFGKARSDFEKYIEISLKEPDKMKKLEVISAYEYLVYYHFLKGNVSGFQDTYNKLVALDPTNNTAVGLMQDFNSRGGVLPPCNGN